MPAVATPTRPPTSTRYVFGEPIGSGGAGSVYRARDNADGRSRRHQGAAQPRLTENATLHKRLAHGVSRRNSTRTPEHRPRARDRHRWLDELSRLRTRRGGEPRRPDRAQGAAVRRPKRSASSRRSPRRCTTPTGGKVIHRDVKPDNILVLPDGRAKLTDFGLAKDYNNDQDLTRHAAGLGTPHFMAPEQFSQRQDRRCRGPTSTRSARRSTTPSPACCRSTPSSRWRSSPRRRRGELDADPRPRARASASGSSRPPGPRWP